MLGAIAGDIIGSIYEHRPIKTRDFPLFSPDCRFTDDTVLTVAVADAILAGRSYQDSIRKIGRKYPNAGYGGSFIQWLSSDNPQPYNSWGNGSAMRVSPVGFAFNTEEEVLTEAGKKRKLYGHGSAGNLDMILIEPLTGYALRIPLTSHVREQCRRQSSHSSTQTHMKMPCVTPFH